VDSWGAPAEMRRRSEEELRGGERSTTCMVPPQEDIATASEWQRGRGGACACLTDGWSNANKAEGVLFAPVSEKAEVADSHKTARSRWRRKRRRNFDGRVMSRFLLP